MCGCVCGEFPEWCASGVPWRVTLFVSPVITLHYITLKPFSRPGPGVHDRLSDAKQSVRPHVPQTPCAHELSRPASLPWCLA